MWSKILAAWLLTASASAASASAAQSVEGRVINSSTGLGIPDVEVNINQPGQDGYSATTDVQGRFRIEDVKEGSYTAMYKARNFQRVGPPEKFNVTKSAEPLQLELKLIPAGGISGRVLDDAGKPVPKAVVKMRMESGFMAVSISSNENGEYDTGAMLPPGTWIVAAVAPPSSKPPESSAGERLGWVQTYFPHATDPLLAAPLVLQPGSDLSKLDIRLATAPVYRIRGVVLDDHGDPMPKVAVKLSQPESSSPWPDAPMTRQGDPAFEFESVAGGEWILSTLFDKEGEALWAAQTLQVTDHDLEVQLKPTAPFSMQGKIVMEVLDGQPAAKPPGVNLVNATVFAARLRFPVVAALSLPGNGFYSGSPDDHGNFTIQSLYQGPYHIIPELAPAGYYLDSVQLGNADALAFGVPVLSSALPLIITYKLHGGTVRGTVEGCGAGKVMLFPQNSLLRRDGFIRQANCGDKGRFEILDVRPGEYYGIAVAPDDPGGKPGAQLDQNLMNKSLRVSVRANESTLSDLHLIAR